MPFAVAGVPAGVEQVYLLKRFLNVYTITTLFLSIAVPHGANEYQLGPDHHEGEDHVGPEHHKKVEMSLFREKTAFQMLLMGILMKSYMGWEGGKIAQVQNRPLKSRPNCKIAHSIKKIKKIAHSKIAPKCKIAQTAKLPIH